MSRERIAESLSQCEENFRNLGEQAGEIELAGSMAAETLKAGGHVFFCGNGGSAADAQHLAAELVGRFWHKERLALPATALHCNTSTLTALANDYSYDMVFARQIGGLARKGDLLVVLSTSGNSGNILKAAEAAKAKGLKVVGLTGSGGGRLAPLCDVCIKAPSGQTPRIQEMHIAVGHLICSYIDDDF